MTRETYFESDSLIAKNEVKLGQKFWITITEHDKQSGGRRWGGLKYAKQIDLWGTGQEKNSGS